MDGFQGRGDTWRMLVKLVQHIWETGEIPYQMLRVIVVLIPKGSSGDYRGIGLLEVVWKLIERVVDARLSKIELHDALHGFRAKCGCGTGIMEAKLTQQLAYREQCPLFGIFGPQKGLRCHGQGKVPGHPAGLGGGSQDGKDFEGLLG